MIGWHWLCNTRNIFWDKFIARKIKKDDCDVVKLAFLNRSVTSVYRSYEKLKYI